VCVCTHCRTECVVVVQSSTSLCSSLSDAAESLTRTHTHTHKDRETEREKERDSLSVAIKHVSSGGAGSPRLATPTAKLAALMINMSSCVGFI